MIAVFYGTCTGNSKLVADMIRDELGHDKVELINIRDASIQDFVRFDKIIIGCPTLGFGELQDDWQAFFPSIDLIDFSGKLIALYGCGDQEIYPTTFADALGIIYDKLESLGARIIGSTSCEGYSYTLSKAEKNGKFCGLIIDEDNQHKLTSRRVHHWLMSIAPELLN